MSDAFEPTTQHFAEIAGLVVCGKFMMKPYLSATASIADMPVKSGRSSKPLTFSELRAILDAPVTRPG
ncbi:MAG: hypothetical protein ABUL62_10805 [Myxococcales bacterium]